MNPSNNQTAGTPTPIDNGASLLPLPEPNHQVQAGQASSGEVAPQVSPLTPKALPVIPLPANSQQPPAGVNQSRAGFSVADDKDVIEPEWVHKAKAIVTTTSDDPYKQSEDLTVLKADYMQKRYNKIVKLK